MKHLYSLWSFTAILLFISNQIAAQPFDGYAVFNSETEDDYFSVSNLLENEDFTVEFWIKSCIEDFELPKIIITSEQNWTFDIFKSYEAGLDDSIYMNIESCINFGCGASAGPYSETGEEWVNLVYQYIKEEDRFALFINGDGPLLFTAFTNVDVGTEFYIGKYWFFDVDVYDAFAGYMDEMRVSTGNRYSSPFTPVIAPYTSDASTIALWHFDEIDYPLTTIADASGNGNELIANGGVYISRPSAVTIIGSETVNAGESNIYVLDGAIPGQQIEWIADGAIITPGGDFDEATINWTTAGTYTIEAFISDPGTECSASSTELTVTVDQQQSISDHLLSNIYVYPVLNNGEFTICNNNLLIHDLTLQLINMLGEEVQRIELHDLHQQVIQLHEINKGYYILKMSTEGKYAEQKMMIF